MLWDAMLKAAKGGMPLGEMRDALKSCGYELCTKRVLGSSENMFIENALAEYARLKSEGLCERQIDSRMQFDRQCDDGEPDNYFHYIIDGREFFDAAHAAVKNSKLMIWCRKIKGERQNFPKAMRLLGSPLEGVTQ